MPSIEVKLKLELIPDKTFEKLEIKNSCKLREAVEYSKKTFKRGRAYYEFIHDIENISEDKKLILMKKVGTINVLPIIVLGLSLNFFKLCRIRGNISLQLWALMTCMRISYLVRECEDQGHSIRSIKYLFRVLDQEQGISHLEVCFFMSR